MTFCCSHAPPRTTGPESSALCPFRAAANTAARCGGVPGRSAFSGSAVRVLKDLPTTGRRETSASPGPVSTARFITVSSIAAATAGTARRGHLQPCPRSATSNGWPWTCVPPAQPPNLSSPRQCPSDPRAPPADQERNQPTNAIETTRVAIGTTTQPCGCRGCGSGSRVGPPRARPPCAASLLPPSTAPGFLPAAWGCWSCASPGLEWKRPALVTFFRSAQKSSSQPRSGLVAAHNDDARDTGLRGKPTNSEIHHRKLAIG